MIIPRGLELFGLSFLLGLFKRPILRYAHQPVQKDCGYRVENDIHEQDPDITPQLRVFDMHPLQELIRHGHGTHLAVAVGLGIEQGAFCHLGKGFEIARAILASGRWYMKHLDIRAMNWSPGYAYRQDGAHEVGKR